MSKAEEKFMADKSEMQNAITKFYKSCIAIDIDNEGFMEDINDAVFETAGIQFEPYFDQHLSAAPGSERIY